LRVANRKDLIAQMRGLEVVGLRWMGWVGLEGVWM
jgi:hypothetical protein